MLVLLACSVVVVRCFCSSSALHDASSLRGNASIIAAAVLLCTGAGGVGGYGQTQTELSRFLLSLSRNKNLVPNHKETADIFPFGYLSFRIYFLPFSISNLVYFVRSCPFSLPNDVINLFHGATR